MQIITTIILAIIILAVSIIDIFSSITLISGKIVNIILATTSIILGLVAISKYAIQKDYKDLKEKIESIYDGINEKITNNKDVILSSIKGFEFIKFKSPSDQIEYIVQRLNNAKGSICDLTWAPRVSAEFTAPARQKKESKYIESIQKVSKDISCREIFVFSHNSRINKLKEHYLRAKKNNEHSGYSCAYYDDPKLPRLQFMIIDNEEIVFTSSEYMKCLIKHKDLVEMFIKYFENAWENAIKLIQNGIILNEEKIKEIIDEKKNK